MDTHRIVSRFSVAGFLVAALSGLGLAAAGIASDPDRLPLDALVAGPAIFLLAGFPFLLYRQAVRTSSGAWLAGGGALAATVLLHGVTHAAMLNAGDGLEPLGFIVASFWALVVIGATSLTESVTR